MLKLLAIKPLLATIISSEELHPDFDIVLIMFWLELNKEIFAQICEGNEFKNNVILAVEFISIVCFRVPSFSSIVRESWLILLSACLL